MSILPRILGTLAVLTSLCVAFASAQSLVEPFDQSGGWTFTATNPTFARWAVDALPGNQFPPHHSAPASLNYNDDVGSYGAGVVTSGTAVSPPLDLSNFPAGSRLTFWEAVWTEVAPDCTYDARTLAISNNGFQTLLLEECMNEIDPVVFGPQSWHLHSFPIDPAWGAVQLRFTFDTVDDFANFADGWFVDDLRIDAPWPPTTTYCTAKVNSQGCLPFIWTSGAPSSEGWPFMIHGSQLINNKVGRMIYGHARAATPFYGGTLCIQAPIKRTPPKNTSGNAPPNDCSGSLVLNFSSWVAQGSDPSLVVGATVDAQFWYRDGASPGGIGLTDGVEFTLQP
jgi:hypothetical protein